MTLYKTMIAIDIIAYHFVALGDDGCIPSAADVIVRPQPLLLYGI